MQKEYKGRVYECESRQTAKNLGAMYIKHNKYLQEREEKAVIIAIIEVNNLLDLRPVCDLKRWF